ncbi:type IV pilus biogenesis protein PilP [Massilia sp. BJB1822]|uniref:type IV pilus biogenesis protein PilP n=1 Tax=Massilia sp. BJB1822 TaxID=2744470 RepID=UPI0015947000|nr:type IV pilus biogenesis protein PilP [Massilia sp. BJB1822]NVE00135.1 type IV pilus biogenesis protein PilP [Massilia sp. BJB1822]
MRIEVNLLVLAVTLGWILPCTALAQNSAAADLTQLEAETTLLKARARKLDVLAQIATRQAEIGRLAAASSTAPAAGNPTVRAIEGVGTPLYATLQMNNGGQVDVKAGDVLPDGLKVVSVARGAVLVQRKGGKPYRLASSDAVPQQGAMAPLPAGMPLPPPSMPRSAP